MNTISIRTAVSLLIATLVSVSTAAAQRNAPHPDGRLTQLVHDQWTEDEGIPQSSIVAIAQTSDGYLWFGTQGGLVRFNGRSFKVYDSGNSTFFENDQKIRDLHVDGRGRLWIGLKSGLLLYEDGAFRTVSASIADVSALRHDASGRIWVAQAQKGVVLVDGNITSPVGSHLASESNTISSLLLNEDGSYWVGTNEGLLHVRNGDTRRLTSADGLAGNAIQALFRDYAGRVWVGTDAGINLVRRETVLPSPVPQIASVEANAFLQDDRGSVWIGTEENGLVRVSGEQVEFFGQDEGLTGSAIHSLLEDAEGSIWIGTDGGGINRLHQNKFTTFSTAEGLPDDIVFTVMEDRDGGLWFGTENDGVARWMDGEMTVFDTDTGLSGNNIGGLATTSDGSVWIGTFGNGLNRFRNGRITRFGTAQGLTDPYIAALYTDQQDRLWIGTNSGVFMLDESRELHHWTSNDGLASNYITAITQDADNRIWVGTWDAGVHRLENDRFVQDSLNDHLLSQQIMTFYSDEPNTLWVATYGGGITRKQNRRVTTFTMAEGLHSDHVYAILKSSDGKFWMTSDNGIFTVHESQFDQLENGRISRLTPHVYSKLDGLKSKEMNGGLQPAGWKARDGRMWFPSIKGVAMIDPMDIGINDVIPPLVIEEVVVNGTPTEMDSVSVLDPGVEKIEISFAALSFQAPEQIQYRYRLIGNDDEWTESSLGTATYTNLPPGDYTFRVVASNNDGVWNMDGETLTFAVAPHYWETIWFILLCIAGLGLSIYGFVRYRTRQMEIRQREIERERDRAREADRFKTVILDNLSHEFRTPLTGILGYAEILEHELTSEQREFVGYIIANGRRLLGTLDSLLELAQVQNNAVDIELEQQDPIERCRQIIDRCDSAAAEKGLSLKLQHQESIPAVPLDATAFDYVLHALLDNALKFTDHGIICVDVAVATGYLEVRVRDEGVGIAKSEAERIFEPFRQLSEGLSRSHEGAGVGLTISRHLVARMGGELFLESSSDDGSTFLIRLPLGASPGDNHRTGRNGVSTSHSDRAPLESSDGGQRPADNRPVNGAHVSG